MFLLYFDFTGAGSVGGDGDPPGISSGVGVPADVPLACLLVYFLGRRVCIRWILYIKEKILV